MIEIRILHTAMAPRVKRSHMPRQSFRLFQALRSAVIYPCAEKDLVICSFLLALMASIVVELQSPLSYLTPHLFRRKRPSPGILAGNYLNIVPNVETG